MCTISLLFFQLNLVLLSLSVSLSIQGLFIFFFHCIFNKEVRKHLKNTLTGKKPLPDDSTATRATLLTVRKSFEKVFLF